MDFILTCISADSALSAGHLAQITGYLTEKGCGLASDPLWLAEHRAVDIPVLDYPGRDVLVHIRGILEDVRGDVLIVPSQNRRKKLLIADMDSTIIEEETLDELADFAGVQEQIAGITARAMNGELDFEAALKERVALLEGLPVGCLQETFGKMKLSAGVRTLIATMSQNGAHCVLVSGGFTFFTERVAKAAGFHNHHGNVLEIEGDKLTGRVVSPILDKIAKKAFLMQYVEGLQIDMRDSIAVGDGANDLMMLETAGLGIGYRPRPLLRERLENCLFYTDLTALLYAQGYSGKDFVL